MRMGATSGGAESKRKPELHRDTISLKRSFGSYVFNRLDDIKPERRPDGSLILSRPQSRYVKARAARLHSYGRGYFCTFRFKKLPEKAGVYLITVGSQVKYIGEANNLAVRFSPSGYGQISPRNCYVGGQSTNCKVNKYIYLNTRRGVRLSLWFHPTARQKQIEHELIQIVRPPWNSIGNRGI